MRVRGNIIPELIHIEPYPIQLGYVEIRLRENLKEVLETDPETGVMYPIQEYDEYVIRIPDRPGLREEIEANLSDWMATGRVLEVNENASLVVKMKETDADKTAALHELGVFV